MSLLHSHSQAAKPAGADTDTDGPGLAVFDFGKTNAKILIFAPDGRVLASARTAPRWLDDGDGRILDDAHLWGWMQDVLREAAADFACERIMITTHGCTFAMIADNQLALPILDYECAAPGDIEADFRAMSPAFDETRSPDLPAGLNYGVHILWRARVHPDIFAKTEAILFYPQYWNWKLCGAVSSEVSFIGCHSHLWAPGRDDFSSLVDSLGWRDKFPHFVRAGASVGTHVVVLADGSHRSLTVHNGVHDSNASLYFYRALGYHSFSLISTGTWVIIFNTAAPLSVLDQTRDMLANVSVDHDPVVTARFMGGREFDLISGSARVAITIADVESAIAKGQMALPSFAAGGPFDGQVGRLTGPEPVDERERAAIGSLYLACMSATVLAMVQSDNTVIIDGGLANNTVYPQLLAALCKDQTVLVNAQAEGTASGAAALAFESFGSVPFADPCIVCKPLHIEGLEDYFQRWSAVVSQR
jgi:sugar (pentulose or hexulose) kinase